MHVAVKKGLLYLYFVLVTPVLLVLTVGFFLVMLREFLGEASSVAAFVAMTICLIGHWLRLWCV